MYKTFSIVFDIIFIFICQYMTKTILVYIEMMKSAPGILESKFRNIFLIYMIKVKIVTFNVT